MSKRKLFIVNVLLSFITLSIFHWILSFWVTTDNMIVVRLLASILLANNMPMYVPTEKDEN